MGFRVLGLGFRVQVVVSLINYPVMTAGIRGNIPRFRGLGLWDSGCRGVGDLGI